MLPLAPIVKGGADIQLNLNDNHHKSILVAKSKSKFYSMLTLPTLTHFLAFAASSQNDFSSLWFDLIG